MAVSTGTIRAVNPIALAEVSGVTKIPRFAQPIPPVIRPMLLTNQLAGCPNCAGSHDGPVGHTGFAGFIPPDYGSLRGDGGTYGIFKILSSGELPSSGLGKGATGAHAADFNTRWLSGRGLGKGATGAHAADFNTRWLSGRGLGAFGQISNLAVPSYGSGNVSVLQTIGTGGGSIGGISIPANTVGSVSGWLKQLESWLGIGAGRREADLITPTQNNLMAQLGTVTQQFVTGTNPTLATLQQLYTQVWILGTAFQEFVLLKVFTDRRASGGALNTVMPYIDGSCGYPVPVGATATPSRQNCISWGDGTLGGVGTNGMLGAIGRAIVTAGGAAPILMDMHQAANLGIAPTAAATINPVTGTTAPAISSALMTAGLPSTIAGLPTGTVLLLGAGLLLLMTLRR